MSDSMDAVVHIARTRAALEAAVALEAGETLEALDASLGGRQASFTFSREHVRLLVRSAFIAGAVHEMERAKLESQAP